MVVARLTSTLVMHVCSLFVNWWFFSAEERLAQDADFRERCESSFPFLALREDCGHYSLCTYLALLLLRVSPVQIGSCWSSP
jgi:hypothetical protein